MLNIFLIELIVFEVDGIFEVLILGFIDVVIVGNFGLGFAGLMDRFQYASAPNLQMSTYLACNLRRLPCTCVHTIHRSHSS